MTSNSTSASDMKGAGVIVGGGVLRNANNGHEKAHEMAPLNTRARGADGHNVTIVLSPPQRRSISSLSAPGGDDPTRAAWSGKMQFFLSIIGYSVGLGNIWRYEKKVIHSFRNKLTKSLIFWQISIPLSTEWRR